MNLKDIMTRNPITIGLDESLATVKEIFDTYKFHHLLVVEEGKLFGVVSDRDLLKAISPNIGTMVVTYKDLATLNKRVHQVMSRKPVTLREDATIAEAAALINTHRISCIPIVDEEFRPVGIVSWRDLIKTLLPRQAQ
ncbi:MAG: CBS domain-containing protein [Burkholderiaceae bacterium]|jgi:acetoin utilization protein AcuB|nr:CBS domain-containing protein [Burkholderiaceae bacterium]